MFLNWSESIGLLSTRNDTNILGLFPYNVRKTVVTSVVERLEDVTNCPPKIFTTPAHVKWLMEVIAQGFTLHMEDLPIIEKCVAVYSKWLLGNPEDKPPGLLAEEVFFRAEMLGHLTFLFEPRSGTSDTALTVQTRLCKDVLDNIILAAAHKLRSQLTIGNWDVWIRLLISVVDSIFMNKAKTTPPMHNLLCKSLSAPAFRVLLEILFLSENQDPEIWNSIVQHAVNWVKPATVQHWCSVVNALTLRTLALMYGPKYGGSCAATLVIDWIVEDKGSVKSSMNLDHEFIFFAWRRLISLLPEPHTMVEAECHRIFFAGISRMVDQLLRVADIGPHCPKASKQTLPNGNTILALVGRWLFNALLSDKVGFEEGTSLAAATTCKLFCRTPATTSEPPFQKEYLASFYASIAKILVKPYTDKVLVTVLLSTKNLLLREFPGSQLLIPSFLYACASQWREPGTDPNVRIACLELISSLTCLADHYQNTKIVSKLSFEIAYGSSHRVAPVVAQFSTVRQHLQVLFSTALVKEDNPRNIIRLLNIIVSFLFDHSVDDPPSSQEGYMMFTSAIISEIMRQAKEHWPTEVTIAAYATLSVISELTPHWAASSGKIGKLVLFTISEHILQLTGNANNKPEDKESNDRIIHRALLTLTDWWMTDPNFPAIMDKNVVQGIIKSIVSCLGIPGRGYTAPASIKAAAEFALAHVTSSASFPHPVGPQRASSEVSEFDIIKQIPKLDNPNPTLSQYTRYFLLDDHIILCMIDVPEPMPESNPQQLPVKSTVYMIMRDSTGKHIWSSKVKFYEREEALNPPYDNQPHAKVASQPLIKDRYELGIQNELYTDLLNYLNSLWQDRHYNGGLISMADSFVKTEKAHLEAHSYGLDKEIKYKLPKYHNPYDSNCKFQIGRVFLGNLGFTHPETYNRLVPLDARPGFDESLKSLDALPERSVISVGVTIIAKPPQKPYDFLADESAGPQDYQDFLTALGWGVNLWEHTGYRGPLVPSVAGDYAPYYANYSTEMIFPVSNWIPNAQNFDATIALKRKILSAGPVMIVWILSGEYEPPQTQREFLHIAIHPLQSGLYKIRLYTRENRPLPVGPLVDNMKLSKRVLGPMVRATAMAATRHLQQEASVLAPIATRKAKIDEIIRGFSRQMTFDDWMMNLLSTKLPPDMNAPAHVRPVSEFRQPLPEAEPAPMPQATAPVPIAQTQPTVPSSTGSSPSSTISHSGSPSGSPAAAVKPIEVSRGLHTQTSNSALPPTPGRTGSGAHHLPVPPSSPKVAVPVSPRATIENADENRSRPPSITAATSTGPAESSDEQTRAKSNSASSNSEQAEQNQTEAPVPTPDGTQQPTQPATTGFSRPVPPGGGPQFRLPAVSRNPPPAYNPNNPVNNGSPPAATPPPLPRVPYGSNSPQPSTGGLNQSQGSSAPTVPLPSVPLPSLPGTAPPQNPAPSPVVNQLNNQQQQQRKSSTPFGGFWKKDKKDEPKKDDKKDPKKK